MKKYIIISALILVGIVAVFSLSLLVSEIDQDITEEKLHRNHSKFEKTIKSMLAQKQSLGQLAMFESNSTDSEIRYGTMSFKYSEIQSVFEKLEKQLAHEIEDLSPAHLHKLKMEDSTSELTKQLELYIEMKKIKINTLK